MKLKNVQKSGLIRYPGGKGKLLKSIFPRLTRMATACGPQAEYREPFFGGGAVGLSLLSAGLTRKAWLNDRDPTMAALWDTVVHHPTSLRVFVEVTPEAMRLFPANDYYRQDAESLRAITDLGGVQRHPQGLVAAMKLAVHQMSYSGIGTKGGAMGDRLSRYNVDRLNAKIEAFHDILASAELRQGTCTCLDFEEMFIPGEAFFYLDPPYVAKGPGLYQVFFTEADHIRLARRLRGEKRPWLLSYDDHPLVHRLYGGWSRIDRVGMVCTINGPNRKPELLISNGV